MRARVGFLVLVGLAIVVGLLLWGLSGRGAGRGEVVAAAVTGGGAGAVDLEALVQRSRIDLRTAGRAAIAGHVRDPKGEGLAGATVCAGGVSSELSAVEREDLHCVESEADGSYVIAGLVPLPHEVHASAPGRLPAAYVRGRGARARAFVTLRAGETTPGVDVVLRPGGVEVKGVVRDLSGGELAGARVSSGAAHARTGPEGAFALWVKPGDVSVQARAEGYVAGESSGVAPGRTFEIYLTPESVMVGRVVRAADGAPIAGAQVWADGHSGWGDIGPAITDAGGNFRFEGLAPGTYKPEAYDDAAFGSAAEGVVLGLGETSAPVTIVAHPAYLVEGTVVAEGGEGCDGGSVELTSGASLRRTEPIEPGGAVRFRGVLPATYTVAVDCVHHHPLAGYEPVVVVDAPVVGLRWDVRAGRAIRGKVVDARGAGVEDVLVSVEALPDPDAPRAQMTQGTPDFSAPDGSFELAGLLPGKYRVWARAEDRPSPPEPLAVALPAGQDLEDIQIALPGAGEVRGTVRDSEGRPVAGASVGLRGGSWNLPSTSTADDGGFRLAGVRAGEYRVVARAGSEALRAPGETDDAARGEAVQVEEGEVVEVSLVVEARSGAIAGKVVDADGGPLTDAFVEVARESDSENAAAGEALRDARWGGLSSSGPPALTDLDGRFELKGLPAGKYTLFAHRRGGGEGTLEHVEVGSEVTLTIGDAGMLAGVVRLAGGGAPERFSVSIESGSGFSASEEFFRTAGAFRFAEVPGGDYSVRVEAEEGSQDAAVRVAEGGRGELQVELVARVTVRGTVVDLVTGAPVPGMQVHIDTGGFGPWSPTGGEGGREVTDERGRFEVARAPAGEVRVAVAPRQFGTNGYGYSAQWVKLTASGAEAVELPPLRVVRSEFEAAEKAGDLGYRLRPGVEEAKTEAPPWTVGLVVPGGPAARAGLQVGDEIVSVDGHDVTGPNRYLYTPLAFRKVGTTVRLGLARGVVLELTSDRPI